MVETRRHPERRARMKASQSMEPDAAASKKQKTTKGAILSTSSSIVINKKAASSGLFSEFLNSPQFSFAIPSSPVSVSDAPTPTVGQKIAAPPTRSWFTDVGTSSRAGSKQGTVQSKIFQSNSNHSAKHQVLRHPDSASHQNPSYHDSSTDEDPSSADEDSSGSDSDDVEEESDEMDPQGDDLTTRASRLAITPKLSTREQRSRQLSAHLAMLKPRANAGHNQLEVTGAPVFTSEVLDQHESLFSQYGFFAGVSSMLDAADASSLQDPRVYFNISAPSSAFICGSQGSGKSHTLSSLLENCLLKSDVSVLENPLAGLVFHYDNFSSDLRGTPCEAAFLASSKKIKVRVLCSPTNIATTKRTYAGLGVEIEPLRINESDLNTKRMLDLMAVNPDSGPMPLYLHAINRILRDLRIIQQETGGSFNYRKFKAMVEGCDMTPAQLSPLTMRLDTLESFMPLSQTTKLPSKWHEEKGNDWTIKPGMLTIVDLSCPCVTSESACALFNMCLSLFLEQQTSVGRVVALDEAHKYMNSSSEASTLTDTLLSSIRLQRHLGARVFVSTQEPTISPALLDLCSITIVHRFTSPEWLKCLRQHLAALDHDNLEGLDLGCGTKAAHTNSQKEIFAKIVKLRVGEALLFAPSAMVGGQVETPGTMNVEITRLGVGYLSIQVRGRLTADGGASIMAK